MSTTSFTERLTLRADLVDRVNDGISKLRLLTGLDHDLSNIRVVVSAEAFEILGVANVAGLVVEADPCLSLGQMRLRAEAVL